MPDRKNPYLSMLPLALLGAVLATFCDAIHAHTGTLGYPHPWLLKQAFWVFPLFFITFVTMAVGYFFIVKWLPDGLPHARSMAPGTFEDCIETMTLFVLVYLLSGFGSREPALLSAIFYGAFVIRLAVTYEKGFLLMLALIMAVAGMAAEGSLALFDLVHYRQPEIFNVPFWLGALYMHGAFALRESMRFFVWGDGRP